MPCQPPKTRDWEMEPMTGEEKSRQERRGNRGLAYPALVIGYGRQPLGNKGGWARRVTWLPRKAMAGDPADPADI